VVKPAIVYTDVSKSFKSLILALVLGRIQWGTAPRVRAYKSKRETLAAESGPILRKQGEGWKYI